MSARTSELLLSTRKTIRQMRPIVQERAVQGTGLYDEVCLAYYQYYYPLKLIPLLCYHPFPSHFGKRSMQRRDVH